MITSVKVEATGFKIQQMPKTFSPRFKLIMLTAATKRQHHSTCFVCHDAYRRRRTGSQTIASLFAVNARLESLQVRCIYHITSQVLQFIVCWCSTNYCRATAPVAIALCRPMAKQRSSVRDAEVVMAESWVKCSTASFGLLTTGVLSSRSRSDGCQC